MRDSESRSSRDRYYSRRHRSKSRSPARSKYKKSKKSKKSKKYVRRSRSSSTSSSTSSRSVDSRTSRSSGKSKATKKQTSVRASSSDKNLRTATTSLSATTIKDINVTEAHVQKALEAIEEDTFQPQAFFSTRDREAPEKKPTLDKVIIDLNSERVKMPKPLEHVGDTATKEQMFHPNFIGDADLKAEKWVRKLYNYRQKYFQE